jgi:predicted DsbA family dithiol-disulfide isomerase
MARELFAAEPQQLTPYNVERIAEKLGLDLPRYRKDIPAAVERVKADLADAKAAGVTGLPTLFIGHARHTGAELQVDDLVREIERFDPR